MITAAAVKAAYPNPRKSILICDNTDGDWTGLYCVGGAYLKYAHVNLTPGTPEGYYCFPGTYDLATGLQAGNPRLPAWLAMDFAVKIIESNDEEQFEEAYEYLDEALTYDGVGSE